MNQELKEFEVQTSYKHEKISQLINIKELQIKHSKILFFLINWKTFKNTCFKKNI